MEQRSRTPLLANTVLTVVAVALAACGGAGTTSPSSSGAGGAGGASASVRGAKGRAPITVSGRSPGALGAGGASPADTASGSAPGGSGSGNVGGPPTAAGATAAVNGYLQGLVNRNSDGVLQTSVGAPLDLAAVLLDAAAIDSSRGATTTMTLGPSSLTPTVDAPQNTVTFTGSVTITTTVTGSRGSSTSPSTISGPLTVVDNAGAYRVTGFSYDGAPLVAWPESASQTVNGLVVSVGFVLSYGNTTAALISVGQETGSVSVQLQSTTLDTNGSSSSGVGDFTGPPQPAGLLRFARISGSPTRLIVDFTTTTGQADDFDLPLS
ncbi:MAG: hypothetical protein ACYDD4_14570 [Acidimicrobiales bacterium]